MRRTMTITELRTKFVEGTYTPLDAFLECERALTEREPSVHAFLEVYDDARQRAEEATLRYKTEGEAAPPLLGMPIAVKNNILVKDRRATAGSRILAEYKAIYDATIIARLREQGALFVGSTNLDEFGNGSSTENSAFGPTKNPLDESRVPGGSSGGSAAAVAMGASVAAIGTDTGGSVRQPASFCGLVGFKPTYGAISRYGLIALGSSLDQAGFLTKSVTDAELLFTLSAGKDPLDATTISKETHEPVPVKEKYRIGVPRAFVGVGVDAEVRRVFDETLATLAGEGHELVDVSLPLMEKGLAAYYIVMPAELSSNLARYDGVRYGLHVAGDSLLDEYVKTRAAGFGNEVKRRVLLGTYVLSAGYYDAYYGKAELAREQMRKEFREVCQNVDVVITPTAPTPAFKLGEKADPLSMYLGDIYTVPVNLMGVPAISLPLGEAENDGVTLPVGMQFIAPHGGDYRLFDLGKKLLRE